MSNFKLRTRLAMISLFAMACIPAVSASQTEARLISADLKSTSGPLGRVFRECVGAGRANEGLRADWQRQLRQAKQDCGFEYIRMHGLLCDDMGVYREERGHPVYNWQYIDDVYDYLLSIGVKPFVKSSVKA